MPNRDSPDSLGEPLTLAIDIGGSHLKIGMLNGTGGMVSDEARVITPKPAQPAAVVSALVRSYPDDSAKFRGTLRACG